MKLVIVLCLVLALLQGSSAVSNKFRAVRAMTHEGPDDMGGDVGGDMGGSAGSMAPIDDMGEDLAGSVGGDLAGDVDLGPPPAPFGAPPPPPVSDMALPSNSLSTPGNSASAANTQLLDQQIGNAEGRLNEINNQLSLDVTTSQDWYEVLQNYQFKYSALLARIKTNEKKKDDLTDLITKMKTAAQSTQANREIEALRTHLGSLVLNSQATGDEDSAKVYEELQTSIADFSAKLDPVTASTMSTAVNDVAPLVNPTADGQVPAPSVDAIAHLTGAGDGDGEEE